MVTVADAPPEIPPLSKFEFGRIKRAVENERASGQRVRQDLDRLHAGEGLKVCSFRQANWQTVLRLVCYHRGTHDCVTLHISGEVHVVIACDP